METELWRAVCAKSTCTVRREGRVTTVPTPICAIKKMSRSNLSSRRRGGAKGKPDRAQPQEKIGEIFRAEELRRTDHPVCGASEASRLFINAAATPPFQGGECVRTETVCQFIHTFWRPGLTGISRARKM